MKWVFLVLVCLAFAFGLYLGKKQFQPDEHVTANSSVLLEKIKDIFKLVFVEAQFNELYTHKEYNWIDISPFRKSAIIRIQAKVTAGVDMDSSSISVDELKKSITLKFDKNPRILYLDHKLDYYDLQQGTFNSFSSTELTSLQDKAKDIIREKALQSDLMKRASTKRDEMINTLNQIVQSLGWKLIIEDSGRNAGRKVD
jgi:hypothetical protein